MTYSQTTQTRSFNCRFRMKPLALATVIAAAAGLSGCGGGDQDKGKPSNHSQSFSGVAVDGHVARATVFIDSNNNGTREPWEPKAFTDDEGYYGQNPNTGADYCASDATEEEAQYCLKTSLQLGNTVIRVDGGYDRLTGEPFLGQMSRRVNTDDAAETVNTVISPITTLVTALPNTSDQNAILANLGLNRGDMDIDYLNAAGNGEVDAYLLNTAIKVHKTVTILSDRIDDNYPQLEEEVGLPNTSSDAIYRSFANLLSFDNQNVDGLLTNETRLLQILDNAEQRIRGQINRRGLELPLDMGNVSNPEKLARAADVARHIPPVVDRLLNVMDSSIDLGQVIGNARALESLVIKATSEVNDSDNTIDNAFSFFLDEGNDSLLEELRIALSDDKADISSLAQNDFTNLGSTEEIRDAARLADDAQAFAELSGKRIVISDLDLGFGPSNLQDIEVEINFQGGPDAVSGSTIACAKYIDGASTDGSLGEGNFHGELITGYWSLLGASEGDRSSYSLLLTFDFLGASYQAIMKPAGSTTISGQEYQQIRFDNDGDIRIWHSLGGLVDQGTLPTSSAECAQRLPSRIGL